MSRRTIIPEFAESAGELMTTAAFGHIRNFISFSWVTLAASLTLAVLLPMVFLPATRASAAAPNPNANYLQVYDNNIENLLTADESCAGEWQDLIHYMASQPYSPDLFLVQQISTTEVQQLINKMQELFNPSTYSFVISGQGIGDTIQKCDGEKAIQLNAIIYRNGRLTRVANSVATWQSKHDVGNGCVPNTQDRTVGVRATF